MPNPLGRPKKTLPEGLLARFLGGASEAALAKEFKVGRATIHRRLVSLGAITRTAIEARSLQTRRSFTTTDRLGELIDGLLLGDAWIELDRTSEGRLCIEQREDRQSWLIALQSEFEMAGVKCYPGFREPRTARIKGKVFLGKASVTLRTGKYRPFTDQRNRWYPNGSKRVPVDVRVGPHALAQWYWGDGSTSNSGYRMIFHTDGFPEEDVRFLQRRLHEEYGWLPTIQRRNQDCWILALSRKDHRRELVSLIRPFCPPCFGYKLIIKE